MAAGEQANWKWRAEPSSLARWRSSRYHPAPGVHRIVSRSSNGWANGDPAARLTLRGGVRFGDAPVNLGQRLLQLRATPLVGGRAQLTLELGAGQSQRFERVHAFRIADRLGQPIR